MECGGQKKKTVRSSEERKRQGQANECNIRLISRKSCVFYSFVTGTSIVTRKPASKIRAIMSMSLDLLILGEGLKFTALCGFFPLTSERFFHITKPPWHLILCDWRFQAQVKNLCHRLSDCRNGERLRWLPPAPWLKTKPKNDPTLIWDTTFPTNPAFLQIRKTESGLRRKKLEPDISLV